MDCLALDLIQNLGWELVLNHQLTKGELCLTKPQYYYRIDQTLSAFLANLSSFTGNRSHSLTLDPHFLQAFNQQSVHSWPGLQSCWTTGVCNLNLSWASDSVTSSIVIRSQTSALLQMRA